MANSKDLYMQFADVSVNLDSSNTTTLVEGNVNTGLSIRGGLVWLIHLIEIIFAEGETTASVTQNIALSTTPDLAAMPDLGDAGVICKAEKQVILVTSGVAFNLQPSAFHYLPPIPLAAPQISIYANTTADNSPLRGDLVEARIGFTTVPLDSALYAEIAETWGWTS